MFICVQLNMSIILHIHEISLLFTVHQLCFWHTKKAGFLLLTNILAHWSVCLSLFVTFFEKIFALGGGGWVEG
jgi:hypothetical protein